MQGTARPGASSVTTVYPYNASNIFTITVYLSQGITSRGRIGIDSTMYMSQITQPYFQDPVDKSTLMTGIQDVLSTVNQGAFYLNLEELTPHLKFSHLSPWSYLDHAGQHDDYGRLRQQLSRKLA